MRVTHKILQTNIEGSDLNAFQVRLEYARKTAVIEFLTKHRVSVSTDPTDPNAVVTPEILQEEARTLAEALLALAAQQANRQSGAPRQSGQ